MAMDDARSLLGLCRGIGNGSQHLQLHRSWRGFTNKLSRQDVTVSLSARGFILDTSICFHPAVLH